MMGIVLPESCWACNKICNKYHLLHLVGILFPHNNDDARSKSPQIKNQYPIWNVQWHFGIKCVAKLSFLWGFEILETRIAWFLSCGMWCASQAGRLMALRKIVCPIHSRIWIFEKTNLVLGCPLCVGVREVAASFRQGVAEHCCF